MNKKILAFGLAIIPFLTYANDRIIVTFAPSSSQLSQMNSLKGQNAVRLSLQQPLSVSKITELSNAAGVNLQDIGPVAIGGRVLKSTTDLSPSQMQGIIQKLKLVPGVSKVYEDKLRKLASVPQPNPYQWDLFQVIPVSEHGAPYFYGASFIVDNTFMPAVGNGVVVGVIDTGYTPHPNFLSNLIPLSSGSESYGYDFITECANAGYESNGAPAQGCSSSTSGFRAPQPNALDLGDFSGGNNSSWHGTHVTGTIIAQGWNGSSGVLGGSYGARVVPVRVLGSQGGYDSDISNGMMWAGGASISGVPVIESPAQILNLSFGGKGPCSGPIADAVTSLTAQGVFLVAAAGNGQNNSGNPPQNVSEFMPANCSGVISVAATDSVESLAWYSNYGNVSIAAPGGDAGHKFSSESGQIYSTYYNESQAYYSCTLGADCFNYAYDTGTSMAAPHVVAAIAGLLSIESTLTSSQVVQILQSSATPFDECNSGGCITTGMLNATKAESYLINSYITVTPSPTQLDGFNANTTSATVTFTNSNPESLVVESVYIAGGNVSNFNISSTSCTTGVVMQPNDTCAATVTISGLAPGVSLSSHLNFYATYNDATIRVAAVPLSGSIPAASSSSGGGGCSAVKSGDDAGLSILLGLSVCYFIRRRKIISSKSKAEETL